MTSLLIERRRNVVELTIHRPESNNALDRALLQDLAKGVMGLQSDDSIRAVILTGRGKIFCAGADIKMFAGDFGADPPGVAVREGAMFLHAAISGLVRLPCPVVTAANGSAGGAGLSLLLAGDVILCAESAKLRMAYAKIGLSPDGGMTALMGRTLGSRRTLMHYMLDSTFTPEEARSLGLIDRVVANDQLLGAARELADKLAAGPQTAFVQAKRLAYRQLDLEGQMEAEREAIARSAATPDLFEAAAAFMEKRAPRFGGG